MTDSTQNPYTDPNPNPNPNPSSSSSIPSLTESSSTRSTLLHVGEIDVNEGEGQQQADAEGLEQRMGAIGLEDAAVPVPAGAGAGGDKQTDRATTGGGGQEHVGDGGRDGDVKEWVGQELEEDEQAYSVQGEAEREGVEVDVGLDEDVWDGLDPVVKYTAWIYEWTKQRFEIALKEHERLEIKRAHGGEKAGQSGIERMGKKTAAARS